MLHKKNVLKARLAGLFIALALISSCSDSGTGPGEGELSENQTRAIEYFKEIALGFEFGGASEVTRKWRSDIKIFLGGEDHKFLESELGDIISELNEWVGDDNIRLSVTADSSDSNFYIFLGRGADYEKVFPTAAGFTDQNFGLFFVSWSSNIIRSGSMYVDTHRAERVNQLHLLREELTQSLGLAKDSDRFSESIFNSDFSVAVTEYSEIDKAVIKMLYHPLMDVGLHANQLNPILEQIVVDVID